METPDNYKRNIWQWMLPELALTLLGLLIYFHHFNGSVGTSDQKNSVDLIGSRKDNSVIISYLGFIDDGPNPMALGHQYTSNALLVLMEATSAAAAFVEVDLKARLASIIVYAARITNGPKQQPMQTALNHCQTSRSTIKSQSNDQNIQKHAMAFYLGPGTYLLRL